MLPINPVGNFREDYGEALICPRCQMTTLPIGYPGALSRADNRTEICSDCGQAEALNQFYSAVLFTTEDWPVREEPWK